MTKEVERLKRAYDKGEQILTAAYIIFGERGYHATKMADIALEAGVAKGTLYLYYKNKEQMFTAVVAKLLQDYQQSYERILNSTHTLPDKLTAILRHHLLFIRDKRDFAIMNIREAHVDQALRDKWRTCVRQLREQFVQCLQQEHAFALSEKDISLSFLCFSGMGDGIIADVFLYECQLTDEIIEDRAQFVTRLFLQGLIPMDDDDKKS